MKEKEHCAKVPVFERLNYFYGQVLGHDELATEQRFFREKMKLHNRCLHGWGVVCGLEVVPVPPPPEPCPPDPCNPPPEPARVIVRCGLALDCQGNEIVVRHDVPVDLWCALSAADQHEVTDCGKSTLYISLCYVGKEKSPSRPALPDHCGSAGDCHFGRIEDSFCVKVSVTPPEHDERCDGCCEECCDPCLLIAEVRDFKRGHAIDPKQLHEGMRRMVSRYRFVTITGINWVHGYSYTQDSAHHRLREGVELHFSRPVRTSTIVEGVAEFTVIEGGDGRSAEIYSLESELRVPDPTAEYSHRVILRQKSKETLQDGDRVILTLRSSFLLDRCCQPVDGEHIGGMVPYVGEMNDEIAAYLAARECRCPPGRPGPWTSGNGTGGGDFVSWIWIEENPGEEDEDSEAPDDEAQPNERRRPRRAGGGK